MNPRSVILNTADSRAKFRIGGRVAECVPPFRMGVVASPEGLAIPLTRSGCKHVPVTWDDTGNPTLARRETIALVGFTEGMRVYRLAPSRIYGRVARSNDPVKLLLRKAWLLPHHTVVVWDNGTRTIEDKNNLVLLSPLQNATWLRGHRKNKSTDK